MRITSAAFLLLAASAQAQLWVVENFDAGNGAAWTFGAPTESIEPAGGFWGGPYLRATGLQTSVPLVSTGNTSTVFTGDYRAASIASVGVALRVQQSATPVTSMHPTIMLVSFNGTPGDPLDDWAACVVSGETLTGIGIWKFTTFGVPASSTTFPAGWIVVPLGPNAPASPNWNVLIQNVGRLAFRLDAPSANPAPQTWEVGVDYININSRVNCYANCDESTVMPCLNVHDFACFINRFNSGDPRANCDGSTISPVLNVQDFSCYLMMFAGAFNCSPC